MSRGWIPPSLNGAVRWVLLTAPFLPSQTNSLIIFWKVFSTWFDIPCTVAKYWVAPPPNICTISCLPNIVGLLFPHLLKWFLTLSMHFDHTASSLMPIQPPGIQAASFSFSILISSLRVGRFPFVLHCWSTDSLNSLVPIGIILVFFCC